jgi:hypothetical protein
MVPRSDQTNYLTSIIQWIASSPSSSYQSQQKNCEDVYDNNSKKTNPRQQLMFARHLRRNRTAYRQWRTLPDCEDSNVYRKNNEKDKNLS